jgi:hypothetical protein
MSVTILNKSLNTATGDTITTFLLENWPKCLLAELNTHRGFSRNSSSSRAIPAHRIRSQVWRNSYQPQWTANQPGMTGRFLDPRGWQYHAANLIWGTGKVGALALNWAMQKVSVHKQDANRLLEPWAQLPVIVSATDSMDGRKSSLRNFFELRAHSDAQPAFRKFAVEMRSAFIDTKAQPLRPGEWHKPYPDLDLRQNVSRVASISYDNHTKDRSVEAHYSVFERLIEAVPVHSSPFEHVAMAVEPGQLLNSYEENGNRYFWQLFDINHLDLSFKYCDPEIHNMVTTANLAGFLQGRAFINFYREVFYTGERNE